MKGALTMSAQLMQSILGSLFSLVFLLVIHRLGRNQQLSFRYTVGWLALGGLGIIASLVLPISVSLADQINLSPAALLGAGAIVLLIILCVQLSISISGMQEQIRRLAEEAAYLREELDESRTGPSRNA
jgi:hypothetical protein